LSEEILRNSFKGKDMVKAIVSGEAENRRLTFAATNKKEREEAAALVAVGIEEPTAPNGA
jgi:hypothetical protein